MPQTNSNIPGGSIGASSATYPSSYSPGGAYIFVNSATGVDKSSRLTRQGAPATTSSSRSAQGPWGDPNFPLASVFGPAGALAYCQTGRGDLIVVLPGHNENVPIAVTVPGDISIIGIGYGSRRPTFVMNNAASQLTFSNAGVQIQNCIFDLTGVATALPLLVSSGGIQLIGCRLIQASATNQAASAIQLNTGADDFFFANGEIDASALAGATQAIIVNNAGAGVNRTEIFNSFIHGFFSASTIVAPNAQPMLEFLIAQSDFRNLATVVAVINLGTGSKGIFENCMFTTLATAGPPTVATMVSSPPVGMSFLQCFGTSGNTASARSGILVPAQTTL